jgi:hypothetical protein
MAQKQTNRPVEREREDHTERSQPAGSRQTLPSNAAEKQPAQRDHQREQVHAAVKRVVERSDVDRRDDQTHAGRRNAVAAPKHRGDAPQRSQSGTPSAGIGNEPVKAGEATDMPRRGNTYRCEHCGMELQVTTDCACSDPEMVRLECCGQQLTKDLA